MRKLDFMISLAITHIPGMEFKTLVGIFMQLSMLEFE